MTHILAAPDPSSILHISHFEISQSPIPFSLRRPRACVHPSIPSALSIIGLYYRTNPPTRRPHNTVLASVGLLSQRYHPFFLLISQFHAPQTYKTIICGRLHVHIHFFSHINIHTRHIIHVIYFIVYSFHVYNPFIITTSRRRIRLQVIIYFIINHLHIPWSNSQTTHYLQTIPSAFQHTYISFIRRFHLWYINHQITTSHC